MRRAALACALAVLGGAGCTPLRSTIPPPYLVDGRSMTAGELETFASERCALDSGGAPPPNKFTTDGCSAWPDNGRRSCCIRHDIAYWCGARRRSDVDREFRACVREAGSAGSALLLFTGVRVGGGRFVPFPWRFGYGYPWPGPRPHPAEPSETRAQTALTTP